MQCTGIAATRLLRSSLGHKRAARWAAAATCTGALSMSPVLCAGPARPADEADKKVWADFAKFREDSATQVLFDFGDRCFREGLKKALLGRTPQRVLDLACGAGSSTVQIVAMVPEDCEVTAIDMEEAQIEACKKKSCADRVDWICGDVLKHDFVGQKFDIITAVGLHNFIHGEEDQQVLAARINDLLSEDGAVVLLFPGPQMERFFRADWPWEQQNVGWNINWREHRPRYSRGDFSFGRVEDTASGPRYVGTRWSPMTAWEPTYLAKKFYSSFLDISFADTKGVYLRDFAEVAIDDLVAPWFDVLIGTRRRKSAAS